MIGFARGSIQLGEATGALTTVRAPPDAQTQLNILHAPLRTLARHVQPDGLVVIDCGGQGQCGPNTLAYLLGLADIASLDGPELREAVKAYVAVPSNLKRKTNCRRRGGSFYTLGELILECYASWPKSDDDHDAEPGKVTVNLWAEAIAQPATWTDLAFLHCVADAYSVAINTVVVTDLSEIWHLGKLLPCDGARVEVELAVGMWWNRHLVALALAPMAAQAEPRSVTIREEVELAVGTSCSVTIRDAPTPHAALPTAEVSAYPDPWPAASRAVLQLSSTLAPHEIAIDCGGGGDCAPNSLAVCLHLMGRIAPGTSPTNANEIGAHVRSLVVAHARQLVESNAEILPGLHIDAYLEASMQSWPVTARHGRATSAETWLAIMALPRTWADEAFLTLAADRFDLVVEYRVVGAAGIVTNCEAIAPWSGRPATARVQLAIWLDDHYAAIVKLANAADSPVTPPPARVRGLEFDPDLIEITNSQYGALLEQSEGLEAYRLAGATDAEAEDLGIALAASMATFPGDAVLLATAATAAAHDDAQLQIGLHESLCHAAAVESAALAAPEVGECAEAEDLSAALAASAEAADCDQLQCSIHESELHDTAAVIATGPTIARGADLVISDDESEPSLQELIDIVLSNDETGADCNLDELHPSELYAHQTGTERNAHQTGIERVTGADECNPDKESPPSPTELTTPQQVVELLAGPNPPTMLVACEFSGAVRLSLEARGHIAISADTRACGAGGLHYRGDVRDIIALTRWARIYFFPPCYQQLRADENCLGHKIADGRAFWGCAFVIWCICCDSADSVIVEQPDTIVHDYLDFSAYPDVEVVEFRTSAYGDERDKFVRLTMRNAVIEAPTMPPRRQHKSPNEHRQFANPDQRDRARSDWTPMRRTCAAVADLQQPKQSAAPLDFATVIAAFAVAWHNDGHPVPAGYLSARAEPSSLPSRQYQQRRGPGDGRRITAVVPAGADGHLSATAVFGSHALESRLPVVGCAAFDVCLPDDCDVAYVDTPRALKLSGPSTELTVGSKRPTRPPGEPGGTGTEELQKEGALQGEERQPPTWNLEDSQTVDVRDCTSAAALLIFVSVLVQPLVLAHVNGFTSAGLVMPLGATRPQAMQSIQALCNALVSATAYLAFMVGEYANGARVFTAPIDYYPPPEAICRTPEQRRKAGCAGAAFVWCTIAALAGSPIGDAATRAVLSCEMFIKPVQTLTDAQLSSSVAQFNFGVEHSRSAIARPALDSENSPPSWQALARLFAADSALVAGLTAATMTGDSLLEGWAERVTPLVVGDVPPHLIENLPDFGDARLDSTPLSAPPRPIRTPWLPLPPPQPAAHPD